MVCNVFYIYYFILFDLILVSCYFERWNFWLFFFCFIDLLIYYCLIASEVGVPFYETSAKIKHNNEECFHEVVRECRRFEREANEKAKRKLIIFFLLLLYILIFFVVFGIFRFVICFFFCFLYVIIE